MLKILRIFGFTAILLFLSANIASANGRSYANYETDAISAGLGIAAELINSTEISVKRGEPYDESKDPALHKSTEPEDGPKHGYFAVSLVILGIVGLFIYFLKID